MTTPSNPSGIPDDEYPSSQQFTTPVDDAYAALVGRATYAWTYLEWQVVSVGEKLSTGFVHAVVKQTANGIGTTLAKHAKGFAGDATLKTELSALAAAFLVLTKRRNRLLHAHPATLHGKQRLHYWSIGEVFDWEPDELVTFTHAVEALARVGNTLYYDPRMAKPPAQIVP